MATRMDPFCGSRRSSLLLIFTLLLVDLSKFSSTRVNVFHFTIDYWRLSVEGEQNCGSDLICDWTHADTLKQLTTKYRNSTEVQTGKSHDAAERVVSVSVYNIHSWWERTKEHGPTCDLPTSVTLAESEESRVRYHGLFDPTFKHFDGHSTTHPSSNVQRVYDQAFLNNSQFISDDKVQSFSNLIKAASYVAGDCHRRDSANSNRDHVVREIRKRFRVEGLGRCLHTTNPEGVTLPTTAEARYDTSLKKNAIARFMFNMAFENSIEDGYVTEKPFDALISGTVPVYLGDATHLRALLPHPKAAIFIADYNGSYTKLAEYLTYLSTNETAYEEHREWRKTFTYEANIKDKPLLQRSWYCNVCRWAADYADTAVMSSNRHKREKRCAELSVKKEGH